MLFGLVSEILTISYISERKERRKKDKNGTKKSFRPKGVSVRQGPSTIPASYDAIRQKLIETSGGYCETGASFQQALTSNFAAKYFAQKNVAFGKAQKTSLGLFNEDKLFTNLALLLSDQCEHCIKARYFRALEN